MSWLFNTSHQPLSKELEPTLEDTILHRILGIQQKIGFATYGAKATYAKELQKLAQELLDKNVLSAQYVKALKHYQKDLYDFVIVESHYATWPTFPFPDAKEASLAEWTSTVPQTVTVPTPTSA
jgi:hypothetical protein